MKAAKDNPSLCALRSFFAERFLLTRDSLGLTQMEFALDLGIDRRSYLDIEHRKKPVLRRDLAGIPVLLL